MRAALRRTLGAAIERHPTTSPVTGRRTGHRHCRHAGEVAVDRHRVAAGARLGEPGEHVPGAGRHIAAGARLRRSDPLPGDRHQRIVVAHRREPGEAAGRRREVHHDPLLAAGVVAQPAGGPLGDADPDEAVAVDDAEAHELGELGREPVEDRLRDVGNSALAEEGRAPSPGA